MIAALLLLTALAGPEAGLASRFGYPGDKWDNGRLACRAALTKRWGERRWLEAKTRGVAHRTYPCGTELLVYDIQTGRSTEAVTVDRGPFGQILSSGRWVARRQLQPGARWRGVLDALPETAAALGLRGLHPVVMRRISSM